MSVRYPTRKTVAALTAALVLLLAVGVSPASAAAQPSSWWYDAFGVSEVQAAGIDGSGVKVAVVDSQINPGLAVFDGTNLHVDDRPLCEGGTVRSTKATDDAVHGSDVTALLIGNGTGQGHVQGMVPGADVTFYGWGMPPRKCDTPVDRTVLSPFGVGLKRAAAAGAQVVSMSFTSGKTSLTDADFDMVAQLLADGVVLVAGTGNTLDGGEFPFSANGVVAVNAFDSNGDLQLTHDNDKTPDVWPETTVVAPGVNFPSVAWEGSWSITGSSLATPLVAGIVAAVAQKYPEATGNQLVQSLIRNTGTKDHDLARDMKSGFGYGPASLRHMLAVDPTGYPDENPLMDKASGVPTAAQVAEAAGVSTVASPTGQPQHTSASPAAVPPSADSGAAGIVITIVIVCAVVLAIAVVIIVIASRRRKTRSTP